MRLCLLLGAARHQVEYTETKERKAVADGRKLYEEMKAKYGEKKQLPYLLPHCLPLLTHLPHCTAVTIPVTGYNDVALGNFAREDVPLRRTDHLVSPFRPGLDGLRVVRVEHTRFPNDLALRNEVLHP